MKDDDYGFFNAVLNAAGAPILALDGEGRIEVFNTACEQLTGYAFDEVRGKHFWEIVIPQRDREYVQSLFGTLQNSSAPGRYEICLEAKDGPPKRIVWSNTALSGGNGAVQYIVLTGTETTEHDAAEEALRNAHGRLQAVLESIPDAFFTVDDRWKFIEVNAVAANTFFGCPVQKLIGKTLWEVIPDAMDTEFYRLSHESLARKHPVHFEAYMEKAGRWFKVHIYPRNWPGSGCLEVFMTDITERKRMESDIKHQAYHDALTGLPNRTFFMEHLSQCIIKAQWSNKKMAVMFLDLDRFKSINDTLGHNAGDELLKNVADRLKTCLRNEDCIARMGGDEFAVLLPAIAYQQDASRIAKKILKSFDYPFEVDTHSLHTSTSIGISIYPTDSEYAESLLKNADIAMYYAKEQGRNSYHFYSPAINVRTLERMILENNLRQTLQKGELVVYYQPQVSTMTQQIVSCEALVRWQHPERGLLNPTHFLAMAEETGFIIPLDEWVMRTACAQNKAWQDAGYPSIGVTVNLSARQFRQQNLIETVSHILEETGLPPQFLELEVSENTAMRDIDITIPRLKKLNKLGVKFSIDDFGTGYSSLSYLQRLPIQKLKIDQSFIKGLERGADDRAIVNAVIALAHHMNLKVVAEGVETEDQMSFLYFSNCDEMQGYLYSEPLPPEKFQELLTLYK